MEAWRRIAYRTRCPSCGTKLNSFAIRPTGQCEACKSWYVSNRMEARVIDGLLFFLAAPIVVLLLVALYMQLDQKFSWDTWAMWVIPVGVVLHFAWYPYLLKLRPKADYDLESRGKDGQAGGSNEDADLSIWDTGR